MDGKSVMGLLLLAAARGSTIVISADGRDELDALQALVTLVERGFGEDEAAQADGTENRGRR
jgi:phosphotransferase system HPr-like phosphotransfer protein